MGSSISATERASAGLKHSRHFVVSLSEWPLNGAQTCVAATLRRPYRVCTPGAPFKFRSAKLTTFVNGSPSPWSADAGAVMRVMPQAIAPSAIWRLMERFELWNLAFKILSSLCPKMGFQLSPAALQVFRRWDENEEEQRAVHEGRPKISRRNRDAVALGADQRDRSLRPISRSCGCGYASRVMESNVRRGAARQLEVYEVSDLVIDLARQRVTRAAAEIALPKLSFDLLLVLIRAAPAVLSNNDLMAQVWPGLVVSPETVCRRVKLLRDALGDDPRAPRYVAGLRGRGYRLVPEVRSVEKASPRVAPQPSPEGRATLDGSPLVDPLSARAHCIRAPLTETAAEAEQLLLAALKIDPQFAPALKQLSLLRSLQGEFAEAVMLAERAIAVDPGNPWSQSRQTAYNRYLELGDLTAARDVVAGSSAAGVAPFQVLQYLGDWRAAGEAVYDVPQQLRGACNDRLAAEAVRDLALHTGDFPRAIRFMDSGGLGIAAPRRLNPVTVFSAVPLAHLLQASGQRDESEKLLDDTLAWVNREPDPTQDSMLWWPHRRVRAGTLALQGHRDAAIAELAEAYGSGERTDWWYTIERDPVWDSMRSDPRFQTIAAGARAQAAAQRALLEEMRRKGEVPYRSRGLPGRRQAW
jgi:DNA-binding winged helix-turn-helix (wHTH) protein